MSEFALVLHDILQQRDISEQKEAVKQLRARMRAEKRKVAEMDEELVQLWMENIDLKLYVATIFRLLVAKKLVTAEELRQLVDVVDAEDGEVDGIFKGKVLPEG